MKKKHFIVFKDEPGEDMEVMWPREAPAPPSPCERPQDDDGTNRNRYRCTIACQRHSTAVVFGQEVHG